MWLFLQVEIMLIRPSQSNKALGFEYHPSQGKVHQLKWEMFVFLSPFEKEKNRNNQQINPNELNFWLTTFRNVSYMSR